MDTKQRRLSSIHDQAQVSPFILAQTVFDDCPESELLERETRCGLGPLRPAWLQKLASKKAYVTVYGILGAVQFALASYFVASISTMEKRFKIPSKASGLINCAWDIGALFASPLVAYLGRASHKPRWVAWGTVLVSFSCYLRLVPHWLYGPGEDALALTEEFGASGSFQQSTNNSEQGGPILSLCGNNHTDYEDCDNAGSGHISATILFIANTLLGIGTSVYYTLGFSYMDDNARKNKAPMLLAISQCLRMLGPTIGYLLASYALEMYVAPDLTPTVDSKDPRWIGAWWFGWIPFGTSTLILAFVMGLFPRSLPRAAQRSVEAATAKGQAYNPQPPNTLSVQDFMITMKRLLSNKVLMCNCLSSVCFLFGQIGQWVFMPKYMETQFQQSAATASIVSGSVGLLCSAAGVFVSAAVISRFRPGPRYIAGWNVLVEVCDVLSFVLLAFIGCQPLNLHGSPQLDGTLALDMDCNADCYCPDSVRYAPVCDSHTQTTFFSACHAGCQGADWLNINSSTKSFNSCSCVADGRSVVDNSCAVDCAQAFVFYIIVQCVQQFLAATGRAGNTLIHFRCVIPEDKPVSIGFSEFLFCACAFIPGPIVFGALIDMCCIVWGITCGETGNCLLYDVDKLRYYVNIPIVVLLFFGTLWDVGVWYHVKGLELYDNDDDKKMKSKDDIPLEITEESKNSQKNTC